MTLSRSTLNQKTFVVQDAILNTSILYRNVINKQNTYVSAGSLDSGQVTRSTAMKMTLKACYLMEAFESSKSHTGIHTPTLPQSSLQPIANSLSAASCADSHWLSTRESNRSRDFNCPTNRVLRWWLVELRRTFINCNTKSSNMPPIDPIPPVSLGTF